MDGMQNQKRPFTQYDDNISPTQEDNGGNGASDAPIQDNGTKNAHFSAGGMPSVTKVDYPLPRDVNSPEGKDYSQNNGAEISDFGLNEGTEVGFNGGVHAYGLVSGEAKQGAIDDSIAGQGFGSGGPGTSDTKD